MNDPTIASVLEKVTTKLEGLAPHVWSTMLRQQLNEGWSCVAWSVAFFAFANWVRGKARAEKNQSDSSILLTIACCLGLLGAILGSLGIRIFLNPEYYALKELFEVVK